MEKNTIHHSLDIETLDTGSRAAVVQIGVVTFDTESGEFKNAFEANIDPSEYDSEPCRSKFTVGAGTMIWWSAQDSAVREAVLEGNTPLPVKSAYHGLQNYLNNMRVRWGPAQIWANSPQFDLAILRHGFEVFELSVPWNYWEERDLRTLKNLFPDHLRLGRENLVHHCAIDDAAYQARQIMAARQRFEEGQFDVGF